MRRLGNWTAFALALAAVTTVSPARGDVPPPPDSPESKRVPATVELDWGVFADRVSKRHVVAAGETLRTIAAKELGNAARSKAIAENNPDVIKDPDRIRVGDVIWLPPLKSFETPVKPAALGGGAPPAPPVPAPAPTPPAAPPTSPASPAPAPVPAPPATPEPTASPPDAAAALATWYDAFEVEWAGYRGRDGERIVARVPAGPLPPKWEKGGTIALLPHAQALPLIAALTTGYVAMNTPELAKIPRFGMGADNLVHREDPTVRIVGKYKLTGIAADAVTADFERVRLDAEGKPVTKTWVIPPPSYDFERKPPSGPPGAPAPAAPPGPTPTGPAPVPTPPAIGMATATSTTTLVVPPVPKSADTPAPTPAEDARWPASTGLIVAGMGAALVAALVLIRRQKAATPPPTSPPMDPPSDPPAA